MERAGVIPGVDEYQRKKREERVDPTNPKGKSLVNAERPNKKKKGTGTSRRTGRGRLLNRQRDPILPPLIEEEKRTQMEDVLARSVTKNYILREQERILEQLR